MKRMSFFVDGVVKSLKAEKAVELHRLKEAWLDAVGELVAGQAEPKKIQNGILYVIVASPHWSQEISLQQHVILKRLRKSLRKPPRKIVCWVGQPHHRPTQAARPGGETEPQVPWLKVPIPPERQAQIDANLATLDDDETRPKLRNLMELAVKREIYLLARGHLPCPLCGTLTPNAEEFCADCRREREGDRERAILRLMSRQPWLSARDLQDRLPGLSKDLYTRLRKQLRSNLLQQAWAAAEGTEGEELLARMDKDFRHLLERVAMLTCSLPLTSLQPRHFHYALGKRLASAYLESLRKSE